MKVVGFILLVGFICISRQIEAQVNDRMMKNAEKHEDKKTYDKPSTITTPNGSPNNRNYSSGNNYSQNDEPYHESSFVGFFVNVFFKLPAFIFIQNGELNDRAMKNGNFRIRSFEGEANLGSKAFNNWNLDGSARYNTGLFSFEFRRFILFDPNSSNENRFLTTNDIQFLMLNLIHSKTVNLRLGYGKTYNITNNWNHEFTMKMDVYIKKNLLLSAWSRNAWDQAGSTRKEQGISLGYLLGSKSNVNYYIRGFVMNQNYYNDLNDVSSGLGLFFSINLPKKNF